MPLRETRLFLAQSGEVRKENAKLELHATADKLFAEGKEKSGNYYKLCLESTHDNLNHFPLIISSK